MTTPSGPPAQGQWWVIKISARGSPATYQTVQAATRPPNTPSQSTIAGPFATQPEAQQFITSLSPPGLGFSIPNPFGFLAALGWIQEIGHWAGILVSAITDLHTYISLGWLMLGFILLIIGILMWLRTTDTYKGLRAEVSTAAVAAA